VNSPRRKFVLDANIFIQAFHDLRAESELAAFHARFAPYEYLSSVVAQELRAGLSDPKERLILERNILAPFVRRGRILTPSAEAWNGSGDVLADMVRKTGLELSKVSKSFGNDVLLALSCREQGAMLVTRNTKDFTVIARFAPFEFTEPWPAPVG
jgi:predicted nucleic acid-binding protein